MLPRANWGSIAPIRPCLLLIVVVVVLRVVVAGRRHRTLDRYKLKYGLYIKLQYSSNRSRNEHDEPGVCALPNDAKTTGSVLSLFANILGLRSGQ